MRADDGAGGRNRPGGAGYGKGMEGGGASASSGKHALSHASGTPCNTGQPDFAPEHRSRWLPALTTSGTVIRKRRSRSGRAECDVESPVISEVCPGYEGEDIEVKMPVNFVLDVKGDPDPTEQEQRALAVKTLDAEPGTPAALEFQAFLNGLADRRAESASSYLDSETGLSVEVPASLLARASSRKRPHRQLRGEGRLGPLPPSSQWVLAARRAPSSPDSDVGARRLLR